MNRDNDGGHRVSEGQCERSRSTEISDRKISTKVRAIEFCFIGRRTCYRTNRPNKWKEVRVTEVRFSRIRTRNIFFSLVRKMIWPYKS